MRKVILIDLFVKQSTPLSHNEVRFHQGLILLKIIRNPSMGGKMAKGTLSLQTLL